MKKPEPVHIMYASDDQSLVGVEASIRSVMKHASEHVVFYYVGDTPLKSLPNVKFFDLTTVAKKYKLEELTNPRERGSTGYQGINSNLANYARFAIDSLLPKEASKAMWIDADTIVRCDVVPMVRNALSDKKSSNIIAAVPGEGSIRGYTSKAKKDFNLTVTFNAGVYVVDLKKWRKKKLSKKIRKITQKNRKEQMYRLGSQSPLVLAIRDKFEHLDWNWNAKVSNFGRDDRHANEKEACLLHWNGPDKPWANGTHKELWIPYAPASWVNR